MRSYLNRLAVHVTLFTGCAFACTAMAGAIIMRHDVPDARYRDFGEKVRGYVVQIALPGIKPGSAPDLSNGMGTLIAPRWVITAEHVANRFLAGSKDAIDLRTHHVYVNGRGYRIAKAFVHESNDIALLQLEAEVKDAKVACLYDNKDELGKPIILAGMGLPGTGTAGVGKPDSALRGAMVRVDEISPNAISWTFRPPADSKSTPLEGISGPGDSGGPAFIERSGQLCIAGVSSGQDTKGGAEGLYGVTEHYTRVSSHLDWIRKVMSENP